MLELGGENGLPCRRSRRSRRSRQWGLDKEAWIFHYRRRSHRSSNNNNTSPAQTFTKHRVPTTGSP